MMDATAMIDAFCHFCLPYGLILVSHHSFAYSPCIPILIPQGPPSQPIICNSVSKEQNAQFLSKISHNIVLMNQDLSENKQTCVFQKFSNHITQYPLAKPKNRNLRQENSHLRQLEGRPKDPRQKENRNILSNLLRIFMRNLFEGATYEQLINRIIQKLGFQFASDDFYRWLRSFNINFKNYIRIKQLAKLFSSEFTADYQTIFIVVMRHFVSNYCIRHCLTSRKINGNGRRVHLKGARSLQHALTQLAFIRKVHS